jgi:hypothetical protein
MARRIHSSSSSSEGASAEERQKHNLKRRKWLEAQLAYRRDCLTAAAAAFASALDRNNSAGKQLAG